MLHDIKIYTHHLRVLAITLFVGNIKELNKINGKPINGKPTNAL